MMRSPTRSEVHGEAPGPRFGCDGWSKYAFWRPILFAAGMAAVVIAICGQLLRWQASSSERPQSGLFALQLPRPSVDPREVVEIQIRGMMRQDDPGLGALQCYCFASPDNRLVTGPFPRFGKLLRTPPYDRIGDCDSFSVGSGVGDAEQQRFVVTTIGEDRSVHLFVWIVERTHSAPFEDCWMTIGVFPLQGDSNTKQQKRMPDFDEMSSKNPLPAASSSRFAFCLHPSDLNLRIHYSGETCSGPEHG